MVVYCYYRFVVVVVVVDAKVHAGRSIDGQDAHGSDLTEAKGKGGTIFLDVLAVNGLDGEGQFLLLGLIVGRNAGEVPISDDDVPVVHGQRGTGAGREQRLSVDGNIGITTGVGRLVNIETKRLV